MSLRSRRHATRPGGPLDPNETRPPPFGPAERASAWRRFREESFDLLVVGGGITGAGIARDAALRGLRVALVEKGDFASGTSSGSSQLVHGGLRYLEHLDFDLVFEALRERWTLLRTAAPFVRPLTFLFPVYEGGTLSPRKLHAGVWLYDLLSWGRKIEAHRKVDPRRIGELEPGLRRTGLRGVMRFADATTDDARLTLLTVRSAAAAGAAASNRAELVSFTLEADRVVGGEVRDALTGDRATVRARFVVNAAGVWAERLLGLTGHPVRRILRPSRGSHLVFPHGRLPVRHAIIHESPHEDERILFVIPWDGFTLVGTTEVDFTGELDRPQAAPSEVEYLLTSANALFPRANLRRQDACGTYAALRPLFEEGAEPTGALSREHTILEGPAGMATIVGGKLTTYRAMAEELVDLAVERLRDPAGPRPADCATEETPLDGALPPDEIPELLRRIEVAARPLSLAPPLGERLLHHYGAYALEVLRLAAERPEWAEPLAPRIPHLGAEAAFAARHEMVGSLGDFLLRRTRLVYGAGDRDLAVARRAAAILAEELDWDDARVDHELQRYGEERRARLEALRR